MEMDLSGLEASAVALNRTVDGLGADDLAAPSLLPDWTRGHVVAHLALNGEALAGVLDAARHGEVGAMYASDDQRDADIEQLAAADPAELRGRLLAATTLLADALDATSDWEGRFSRTPGAPELPVAEVLSMRRREVEIHHADLGSAYTRGDWPEDFTAALLASSVVDQADAGPFRVHASDLGHEHAVGEGGPTVSGTGADLSWWLTGRGSGDGLTSDSGVLPTLFPWRRASATAVPTPET